MAYTTINDLPERLRSQLIGTENLLITDDTDSYRVTFDTIKDLLLELPGGLYQELTNVQDAISEVDNRVSAIEEDDLVDGGSW